VPATALLVGTLVVTAARLGEAVFSEPLPIVSLVMLIRFEVTYAGRNLLDGQQGRKGSNGRDLHGKSMRKRWKYYRLPEGQYRYGK
jgi:hypothetical protein